MKHLRQRAEAKLKRRDIAPDELTELDSKRLLQELRTHHIELELQNEELHRAQQSLLESRDRYADLYHSAPVGYATLDSKGNIADANIKLAQMLDMSAIELIQKPFSNFIASEDQDSFYLLLRRLSTTKNNQSCELRLCDANGKQHWVLIDCNAAIDDGDISQIRTSISDISSLKHTEQLLKESRTALKNSILERTVELEKARAMSEQACQSKSDVLSFMIQQLHTPTNTILSFAQVMAKQTEDEHKDMADSIVISAHYLLSLVNDLQNLHEIEFKPHNLDMQPLELCQSIHDCLSLLSPTAQQKQIHIQDEITPLGVHYIKADPKSLQQVLINLISNAIKYTQVGGKITLSCRNLEGIRIRLCVTDNGPGITEENIEKIFTPFTRLSKDLIITGTGVGLTITRKLVEHMGGVIGVESLPGQGSTFWIEIGNAPEKFKQVHEVF